MQNGISGMHLKIREIRQSFTTICKITYYLHNNYSLNSLNSCFQKGWKRIINK